MEDRVLVIPRILFEEFRTGETIRVKSEFGSPEETFVAPVGTLYLRLFLGKDLRTLEINSESGSKNFKPHSILRIMTSSPSPVSLGDNQIFSGCSLQKPLSLQSPAFSLVLDVLRRANELAIKKPVHNLRRSKFLAAREAIHFNLKFSFMPLYETVFIARQDLAADDVDALTGKLSKIITDGEGKIVSKEYWGLRSLAYKVKKNARGHYVLLNINSDYSAVAELNRVMGFNEDIIRNVTYNVEEHQEESPLFASTTAKDFKPGKLPVKKEPSKADLVLDQVQFDV